MKQSGHNIESGTSRTVAPAFAIAKAGAVADNTKGRFQITEFSMQAQHIIAAASAANGLSRSEERRVVKECVSKCRSRCSREHDKKKNVQIISILFWRFD